MEEWVFDGLVEADGDIEAHHLEVPGSHEPVASVVARAAKTEDVVVGVGVGVELVDGCGDALAGELHEDVEREADLAGHEVLVEFLGGGLVEVGD